MNLVSGLDKEAAALVNQHRQALVRLPKTFLANTLVEIQKWPDMFEPEKKYFRALFDCLSAIGAEEFQGLFGSLQQVELETGCNRLDADNALKVQTESLDLLRSKGAYSRWREEVDRIFQKLEPQVASRLDSTNLGPRLVVVIYGEGIALQREKLWSRLRDSGLRVPLNFDPSTTGAAFLGELFTGRPLSSGTGPPATLFDALSSSGKFSPSDSWIVEAGDALHAICERSEANGSAPATGLSYSRLRSYRARLSDAINAKVAEGKVTDPVELHTWLRTIDVKPQEGVSLYSNRVILSFIRDIFVLGGNGTLIVNNSFVEWSSVEAMRRAQPRVLVTHFGVREKMKPFSSLLLFSKPRATDQIPILEDPLGSFVDVEMLSYYIWLRSKDTLPYRKNTLYLLLAEGADEMLAILPGKGAKPAEPSRATLSEVAQTMAEWLGVQMPGITARPIPAILS